MSKESVLYGSDLCHSTTLEVLYFFLDTGLAIIIQTLHSDFSSILMKYYCPVDNSFRVLDNFELPRFPNNS